MFEANIFSRYIQPGYLNIVAVVIGSMNLLFIALIFIYLRERRRTRSFQKGIKKSIELWFSRTLLEEFESPEELPALEIPAKFHKHFKNKTKREFTVNQLIDVKKNLTGNVADNVLRIYLQLGLKNDSIEKLNSKTWYKKVKGIHELSVMGQKDMIPKIYKYTNSHNEYVRMEAQTAMINFYGFDGLRFLDVVTHPISEWEQLKLLEQLKALDFTELKNLGKWLQSANDTVIIFALKLAEVYQQYHVHDIVVECLRHENEKVRVQAITTLTKIAQENTPAVMVNQYQQEHFTNRQNILNALLGIASDKEEAFLVEQLDEKNDFLKLSVARVIAKNYADGFEILKNKAIQHPDPYQDIYFHLKSELQP